MLVVERDAERAAPGHAGQDGAIPVATREHHLLEAAKATGGGPVATGVEVRILEQ